MEFRAYLAARLHEDHIVLHIPAASLSPDLLASVCCVRANFTMRASAQCLFRTLHDTAAVLYNSMDGRTYSVLRSMQSIIRAVRKHAC
eukprot:8846-Heterococcus_DN1.PRE.2